MSSGMIISNMNEEIFMKLQLPFNCGNRSQNKRGHKPNVAQGLTTGQSSSSVDLPREHLAWTIDDYGWSLTYADNLRCRRNSTRHIRRTKRSPSPSARVKAHEGAPSAGEDMNLLDPSIVYKPSSSKVY
ncbi:unnamed protein product [Rhizoctonia solani]|uniref:Uncharacterized protein n=1 Tax=Rhizoctonia solani TaxID=456999 RepID=A0A8H2WF56_9AGAM|nr:unnamed protein product [Rhizoctonia solani]